MPETIEKKETKLISRDELAKLLENEDYSEAEDAIHAHLEQFPNNVELLNSLGSIYARRGDYFNAENTFRKVIEVDPGCGDAFYNLGLVHSKQSRKTEAVEDFLKAVEINPGDAAAHNDLGVLYHSQGKMHLAKGHFIKALEADILYKRALLNLFEVCFDADSYSEGLAWIEKFLEAASANDSITDINPAPIRDIDPERVNTIRTEADTGSERRQSPGALKLTKKSHSKADDIFLKHVPEELREKKTGENIAIIADFNIAGQLSLLFRMINRYTIHKARLVIIQDDYLSYDRDLILSRDGEKGHKDALDIVENADFYHMGRFPKYIEGVNWEEYLKPDNSLIQYYGSEIRANAVQLYKWHKDNKILGLSCWDYTMLENAPFFYHTNIMCDLSRIRQCSEPTDKIRICHPPTNRQFKKTDLFLSVVDRLKKKNYPFEVELIEHKTNEECLDIKSRCHMTYDQISVGIYGLSAIESMAAGHAVLCGISNFATSYHPDNPIVYVTEENLYDKLEYLLKNKDEITRTGNAGKIWARTHHDPMKLIRQYVWIYDLVINGHGVVDNRDKFLLT
ncbi:MAG: tetratricopeptide repeat protein [Candidatus Zixiibacteriota bacterium]|nr:MAG: tetratricopeptide repeat protein [candidate division Zixibacteria bacterium]